MLRTHLLNYWPNRMVEQQAMTEVSPNCSIWSCHRHKQCMYTPCRAPLGIVELNTDGADHSKDHAKQRDLYESLYMQSGGQVAYPISFTDGCPRCNGDCGSANPPVINCPMRFGAKTFSEVYHDVNLARSITKQGQANLAKLIGDYPQPGDILEIAGMGVFTVGAFPVDDPCDEWNLERMRPAEPKGIQSIWYRGWEVSWDEASEYWTNYGWAAYKGGCDIGARHLTDNSYASILDAIDDEEDEA